MEAGAGRVPVLADHGLRGQYGFNFQLVYPVFRSVSLGQTAAQVPEISNARQSQCDDLRSLAALIDVDNSYFGMEVFLTCGP